MKFIIVIGYVIALSISLYQHQKRRRMLKAMLKIYKDFQEVIKKVIENNYGKNETTKKIEETK